ncbi:MAG: hypothetical protein HDT28_01905 [Clostridiales bacterium]|nr:hypothetical protein [Clostridiales bacterium]
MLYQKKMLILSGDGKGVVLVEKSAGGAMFSLRTFDLRAYSAPLKVGIVTKTHVVVRDLPAGDDPALAFSLDVGDITELHFAVFDDGLRLYGTNAKRMWEANLMDLLARHDHRPPPVASKPTPAALPPLSPKPEVLPMPDGTGIPQSRLSLYGDEAIAEADFYTTLDLSARMPVVDKFLDTPRVLDDRIAPRIEPRVVEPPKAEPEPEQVVEESPTVEAAVVTEKEIEESEEEEIEIRSMQEPEEADEPLEPQAKNEVAEQPVEEEKVEQQIDIFDTLPDDIEEYTPPVAERKEEEPQKPEQYTFERPIDTQPMNEQPTAQKVTPIKEQEKESEPTAPEAMAEAAAVNAEIQVTAESASMPWEREAIWLKKRAHRTPVVSRREVKPIKPSEQVKRLRECAFFERVRADVQTLFSGAPKDDELNKLLPDLEWVKVDFDGKRISVGRSGNVALCYAIAGSYDKVSPLGNEAQWLPRDRNMPTGKGYWLIFQNMVTGEIIEG